MADIRNKLKKARFKWLVYILLAMFLFTANNAAQASYDPEAPEAVTQRAVWEDQCAQGSVQDCYKYAVALRDGYGGGVNVVEAAKIFTRQCDESSFLACHAQMATMGFKAKPGEGLPLLEEALINTQEACAEKDLKSCDILMGQDPAASKIDVAGAYFTAACAEGIADACYSVTGVKMYISDPKDEVAAREFAGKSCDMDYARGCMTYGLLARTGKGGPKDIAASDAAWGKSCSIGYELACNWLKTFQRLESVKPKN